MKGKPLVILGVTFLIILAIGFILIRPVAATIWSSWKSLKKAETDLKTVEEKKQILTSLKENQDLATVGDIALKYIPIDSQSGQLVIELTAVAQSNNLKVEETSLEKNKDSSSTPKEESTASPKGGTPSPTTSGQATNLGQVKEVEFSMKLSGTYNDFINFLREIESSARLITLNDMSMQMTSASGTQAAAFSVQISGVAYYKPAVSIEKTIANLNISEATIKHFLDLKTYGQPINLPTESGFGRTNPFEGY